MNSWLRLCLIFVSFCAFVFSLDNDASRQGCRGPSGQSCLTSSTSSTTTNTSSLLTTTPQSTTTASTGTAINLNRLVASTTSCSARTTTATTKAPSTTSCSTTLRTSSRSSTTTSKTTTTITSLTTTTRSTTTTRQRYQTTSSGQPTCSSVVDGNFEAVPKSSAFKLNTSGGGWDAQGYAYFQTLPVGYDAHIGATQAVFIGMSNSVGIIKTTQPINMKQDFKYDLGYSFSTVGNYGEPACSFIVRYGDEFFDYWNIQTDEIHGINQWWGRGRGASPNTPSGTLTLMLYCGPMEPDQYVALYIDNVSLSGPCT